MLAHRGEPRFAGPCRRTPGAAARHRVLGRSLGVGRIVDRRIQVDHRLRRKDPEPGRDQRRGRAAAAGDSIGARACHARSCGGAPLDQPVGRDHARSPAARPNRQAVRLIDRVPFDGHRAAGVGAGPDDLLGKLQVDPADPAAAARIVDLRRRGFRLAGSDAHIASTSWRDVRIVSADAVLRAGTAPAGSALASALCTPTWNILGVKRSTSTPATSIRAASASPIRSSSQARSAAQSTGLTSRGARARPAAHCAARYAPSATRAACPSAASASRGRPRWRRATASRRGRADRIEPPDDPRVAPRVSPDIRPAAAAAARLDARLTNSTRALVCSRAAALGRDASTACGAPSARRRGGGAPVRIAGSRRRSRVLLRERRQRASAGRRRGSRSSLAAHCRRCAGLTPPPRSCGSALRPPGSKGTSGRRRAAGPGR